MVPETRTSRRTTRAKKQARHLTRISGEGPAIKIRRPTAWRQISEEQGRELLFSESSGAWSDQLYDDIERCKVATQGLLLKAQSVIKKNK